MTLTNTKGKVFIKKDEPFICDNCDYETPASIEGSCRNHCPKCLYSKHLDVDPGDRLSDCKGLMMPIDLEIKGGKYRILHECKRCGFRRWNKAAMDDEIIEHYEKTT